MWRIMQPYVDLSRILRPTGIFLLWIPCLFGLSVQPLSLSILIDKSVIFLIGAMSLRTVGCVINDILDRKFDAYVERTKNRPLASGKLTVNQALVFCCISLIPGFFVFLWLPFFNQCIALFGLSVALIYPLFKRFTHFPQLVLGIAFNIGILVSGYGFAPLDMLLFIYIGSVFWTLAYDTIYAFQDEKDDSLIGVKSTAVYFKNHPKKAVLFFYTVSFIFYALAFLQYMKTDFIIISLLTLSIFTLNQIRRWDSKNPRECLDFFKLNTIIGIILCFIFYMTMNFY
jgi:4-hydroxybenzoate polyprenyltransferase